MLNLGVYYTSSESKSGHPGYNDIKIRGKSVPYLRFADDYGNALAVSSDYRTIYTDTAGAGKLFNWKYF